MIAGLGRIGGIPAAFIAGERGNRRERAPSAKLSGCCAWPVTSSCR